ncbi:MAG: 6,7-dimethyl-8-ribityllumazine synthase [Chloroflexi bacterium CG07_land_8_20_14_0_80_45_17]|nr:MAG: 6,7-dimethyl-8-ribityllumazine synthase [Chloroflexi bacterium CG23_combo_of_CG06-09_8_20_14_all_45_10]PIU56196.1 MAG: 6,7-dimethyl-8-ribityllumazine synthase [Chloroflexi bacterium CG07_land_8_20_14_0_80_45_17]
MAKHYEGMLVGEGLKFAVVVSRFNELITNRLLEGARDALLRHGVDEKDIDIAWTPGCFEIPLIAKRLAQSGKYNSVICLGAVIRGGTPHFEYIASEVHRGIGKISLDTALPIIQGIITADTLEQAVQRAGAKEGNKGFLAAVSAIEMANLLRVIASETKQSIP